MDSGCEDIVIGIVAILVIVVMCAFLYKAYLEVGLVWFVVAALIGLWLGDVVSN